MKKIIITVAFLILISLMLKESHLFAQSEPVKLFGLSNIQPKMLQKITSQSKTLQKNSANLTIEYIYQTKINNSWVNDSKYTHTFDQNGNRMLLIGQYWFAENWENSYKIDYSYVRNKLTERTGHVWSNGIWTNYSKAIFHYNTKGDSIEYISQYWTGSNYANDLRDTMIYDESRNLIEHIQFITHNDQWVYNHRDEYKYDNANHELEHLQSSWSDRVWVYGQRITKQYDSFGNIIENCLQLWDDTIWVNYHKDLYTYDPSGNQIGWVYQNWDIDKWKNGGRDTKTYDINNNLIKNVSESWINNNWLNSFQEINEYDITGHRIQQINQYWLFSGGIEWLNADRVLNSYDASGNNVEYVIQEWVNNDWLNRVRDLYLFDSIGNNTKDVHQLWTDGIWRDSTRLMYQRIVTSIYESSKQKFDFYLSNNYPNPFNPTSTISFSIPQASNVTLKVFDLLGKDVATIVNDFRAEGKYNVEFNAINLSSGIYFYRLQSGKYIETRKMILIK